MLAFMDFLVVYNPTQSPWPGQEGNFHWQSNTIDIMFLQWIRRTRINDPNPSRGHASQLQKFIYKVDHAYALACTEKTDNADCNPSQVHLKTL